MAWDGAVEKLPTDFIGPIPFTAAMKKTYDYIVNAEWSFSTCKDCDPNDQWMVSIGYCPG